MKKFANVQKQKLKKKSEVQKEDMHAKRKQMYKNKEKLMQNEASHDDNIIVYSYPIPIFPSLLLPQFYPKFLRL